MVTASLEVEEGAEPAPGSALRPNWLLPVCVLYAADKALAAAARIAGIAFPSSLIGMVAIVALLLAIARWRPAAAQAAAAAFQPGVDWVCHKWCGRLVRAVWKGLRREQSVGGIRLTSGKFSPFKRSWDCTCLHP